MNIFQSALCALIPISIPVIPSICLALPPAIRERSWKRFFIAFLTSALGIVLPLITFLFSIVLLPEWKGGCHHGWIDCFHAGKFILTPLVLWGCVSFYAIQVLRVSSPLNRGLVLGIFTGATVSTTCLLIGLFIHGFQDEMWGLVFPLYTAIWYTLLCARAVKQSELGRRAYIGAWISSLPFWAGSLILSRINYATLPDTPPSCFIVTAAQQGHPSFVGPFTDTSRNSSIRCANEQLLIFWKLEEIWHGDSPRSHAIFRRIYNRLGPRIAKLITRPLIADMVYLSLKPAEWFAATVINQHAKAQ